MPTMGVSIAQSSDAVVFEGGYDPNLVQTAAKELDSSQTVAGTTYGPQRVVTSAVANYIATATSQPTATVVNTDTSWSFASKVNHLLLQNNSSAPIQFELDATSTAGSPILTSGNQMMLLDVKCTAIHLYTSAVTNINGTAAGNIVIRGWA